MIYHD
jgi:hypothetical protein